MNTPVFINIVPSANGFILSFHLQTGQPNPPAAHEVLENQSLNNTIEMDDATESEPEPEPPAAHEVLETQNHSLNNTSTDTIEMTDATEFEPEPEPEPEPMELELEL